VPVVGCDDVEDVPVLPLVALVPLTELEDCPAVEPLCAIPPCGDGLELDAPFGVLVVLGELVLLPVWGWC